jgi:NO-binding membrane sensor protein with MHYT domain
MLAVHNFSYGLLTPIVAYLMSCLGCFLGLRCTTRARAFQGAARARWLLLAGLSIGVTGIWVMHFIAMLGFTMPGQSIGYNVPVTILSMLIAIIVVSAGLLIVGFSANGVRPLLLGGVVIGCGVASMHYMGMAAVLMPGVSVHYSMVLVGLSVVIAIVAGTAALWAALRLQGLRATLVASLIMGVAVSGMHYTGMAALRMGGSKSTAAPGGASAEAFLLPLIIGISVLTFVLAAVILLSPTEEEIREDAILMERIARLSQESAGPPRP